MTDKMDLIEELRRYVEVSPGSWPGDELDEYLVDLDERIAKLRGREPEADAYKQALVEIRDRCGRVAEARAVARRVLGE